MKKIEKNKLLKNHNTMRVDCVADYFLKAEKKEDVLMGLDFSKEKKLPFLIIGRGSNLIFPSKYKGLIIFLGMDNFEIERDRDSVNLVTGAGAYLPQLSYELKKHKGEGLEWAGGVPGSVGGAVRGNAGAFGSSVSDYVKKVKAVNINSLEEQTFDNKDCQFDYRESVFKKNKELVILEVEMTFPFQEKENNKFNEYLEYRREKHPLKPSAGSVFKNIKITKSLSLNFPEITEKFKESVPAGFLIESCGLKGERVGGAEVSLKHANFIINQGDASGEDVVGLIEKVKQRVGEEYGVELEEEVEIVNADFR
ncbi:MAG: UDP-N-acetylmuramate dehydrogenase [Candidatus Pacebacteria bacterium]|nr:UDP-N-acetylmuramate dehydrogenase [Candidatus Paceibacterota bacterium]